MPYQIKNGIIYSGNAVTLTQAQYDALPAIQKNNGTVYYIYDSNDIVDAEDVGVNGGNVEDLAGSVATFETSQATSSHAVGEYILYQANLYKVIAPIDSGETLTVGSNIESAKVGDELSELKSGLTPTSYTSPSVYSSRATSVTGGYVIIGKLVLVNITFKAAHTASGAGNSSTIFVGLPVSKTSIVPLTCVSTGTYTSPYNSIVGNAAVALDDNGRISFNEITTDNYYGITGVYLMN